MLEFSLFNDIFSHYIFQHVVSYFELHFRCINVAFYKKNFLIPSLCGVCLFFRIWVWSCGRSACFSLCFSTWARRRQKLGESRMRRKEVMKEKPEKRHLSSRDPHWTLLLCLCSGDTGSKSRPSTRYTPSANQHPAFSSLYNTAANRLSAAVAHYRWRRMISKGLNSVTLYALSPSSVITTRDSTCLYFMFVFCRVT